MKRILGNILAAVAALLAALPLHAQVNAEQVMAIGRNVMSMEDYMLAIQYFNRAINAKPYLADPYFYRALAKLELDDFSGAVADCTEALERNSFKVDAYKLRGFARMNLGQDSLAIPDFDTGLMHNPVDKFFLYYKVIAQVNTKQYEGADSTFSTLLRAYPGFEDGYVARAHFNLQRSDTVAALADVDRALGIQKNLLNGHLLKAQILADRREWTGALECMDKAVTLQPQSADLYINRAFLRYNDDDYFGAMADYNYALELEPRNYTALYNRALLRSEVRDLARAAEDFTAVLELEPDNFYALYNRGIIRMDTKQHKEALRDFDDALSRYPKFYPAYYAKAQVYQNMGRTREALENYYKGEDLVRRYVKNPEANPLDKPKIERGVAGRGKGRGDMTESEVVDQFNRLVTVANTEPTVPEYGTSSSQYKGKVQDRNLRIEALPMLALTIDSRTATGSGGMLAEVDDFNSRHYISERVGFAEDLQRQISEEYAQSLFGIVDNYTAKIATTAPRPADLLARGLAYLTLKDYSAAAADFDRALQLSPDFDLAKWARVAANVGLERYPLARADLLSLLEKNPGNAPALYDLGVIYYNSGDYSSALHAFNEAVKASPGLGSAYYNRGLCHFRLGNRIEALKDLSKAGELGVLPAYNLMKRMN